MELFWCCSPSPFFLNNLWYFNLWRQFIEGRLAKLNAGRGFTDVYEEEITEGGFCGSECHLSIFQWVKTAHTVATITLGILNFCHYLLISWLWNTKWEILKKVHAALFHTNETEVTSYQALKGKKTP